MEVIVSHLGALAPVPAADASSPQRAEDGEYRIVSIVVQ